MLMKFRQCLAPQPESDHVHSWLERVSHQNFPGTDINLSRRYFVQLFNAPLRENLRLTTTVRMVFGLLRTLSHLLCSSSSIAKG